MRRLCTVKEISQRLKSITIICDTRENANAHIVGYFDKQGISHKSRKLYVGDYSFEIEGTTYEDEIVIERKHSIDEIASNFTADRQRFENEFLRAKANGIKVFLLVENCSWKQINAHDYRSRMAPKALKASLMSWQVRYGITVNFCTPGETAELIYGTLYYWLKERLERA